MTNRRTVGIEEQDGLDLDVEPAYNLLFELRSVDADDSRSGISFAVSLFEANLTIPSSSIPKKPALCHLVPFVGRL